MPSLKTQLRKIDHQAAISPLDRNDPIVRELPARFLAEHDPAAIVARLPIWLINQAGGPRLAACEYLRRVWNKAFEALGLTTYVLTIERVQAVCRRLDEGFGVQQLARAIIAYAAECKSQWRVSNPTARKPLEDFLNHGRLDIYLSIGEQRIRADRQARAEIAASKDGAALQAALGESYHRIFAAAVKSLPDCVPLISDAAVRRMMWELHRQEVRCHTLEGKA